MNILFYGGHYWDRGSWFRKQQFALRFSKRGHRVFYVEESPSIIRMSRSDKNSFFRTFHKKVNDNLYIITPSGLFPFPRNYVSRHLYNLKLLSDIRKVFRQEGVNDYIIWTNKVEFGTVFDKIDNTIILDICDDLPLYFKLYNDERAYRATIKFLEIALKNTDIPIVSAEKLREKYQKYIVNRIMVVPNGHDVSLSDYARNEIPNEIENISSPRVGFLGSLFKFIDEDLLVYLVQKRPNFNFIFVGNVDPVFPVEKIKGFKNVHLLGMRPKEQIRNYISGFDVCINPFKVHEVNDSVNPVKVFEYLALKKPIVSTYMYSLMKEEISNYIYFASNKEEFLYKLDYSVNNSQVNNVPDNVIMKYHWDNLFLNMLSKIKKVYDITL